MGGIAECFLFNTRHLFSFDCTVLRLGYCTLSIHVNIMLRTSNEVFLLHRFPPSSTHLVEIPFR